MRTFLSMLFLISFSAYALDQKTRLNDDSITVYLIPGQGSDHRLYKNLVINRKFKVRHIQYFTPDKGCDLPTFALELAKQIDTNERFVLIGTSLGGMLATEISTFTSPEKTIIISSAKNALELPKRYRFQQKFPIYKLVGARLSKAGARCLQPIVEPDRKKEKEVFKAMLRAKDPLFLKRTITMIINWKRTKTPQNIIHIHGDSDHTLPIRCVTWDYKLEKGSHMMMLTRAEELSTLLNAILSDLP